jgi:hypothetical protein
MAGDHAAVPGAVRLSLGVGTTWADLDYFLDSIQSLIRTGPKATYSLNLATGDYEPDDDPRNATALAQALVSGAPHPNPSHTASPDANGVTSLGSH